MHLHHEDALALDDACLIATDPTIVQDVYSSKNLVLEIGVNRGCVIISYFDFEDRPEVFAALLKDCQTRCKANTLEEIRSKTAWVITFMPLKLA